MSPRGPILILVSAVLFAVATATAKAATTVFGAHPAWVTLMRFSSGVVMIVPVVLRDRSLIVPRNPRWVAIRAGTNIVAVFLVFSALATTTVSNVNLLNMTYPVFVFAFAPLVTRERTRPVMYLFLAVTLYGVWNVVRPDGPARPGRGGLVPGDLLALASAVVAGMAISALRRARASDSTPTILFWMMGAGTVLNALVLPFVPGPPREALGVAAVAGILGAVGQVALTNGFRYVSAAAGSIISTARIPIAGLLGVLAFGDRFNARTVLGSVLVVVSLVGVSLIGDRRARVEDRGTV